MAVTRLLTIGPGPRRLYGRSPTSHATCAPAASTARTSIGDDDVPVDRGWRLVRVSGEDVRQQPHVFAATASSSNKS